MKRPEKEAVVAQLTEQFRNADAVYLTEYRGLTVPQVSELREKLGRDTSYTVAKNTLARIAAKEAGIEGLDDLLKGPTAITFVKGDFIEAAKTLRDFAKTNKALVISGGYADGTVYDGEGATKLADMAEIIVQKGYKRVMVFCNQKYTTAMLANQMARLNFVVDSKDKVFARSKRPS